MTIWNSYTAPNLGLLFYKRLYKENSRLLKLDNDKLTFNVNDKNSEFNSFYEDFYNQDLRNFKTITTPFGNHNFTLFTTYPGLLFGTGYTHSTKTTGDAAIGFYFDHTSGLPVIPGSSIKGVLRSLFELDIDEKKSKEVTGQKSLDAINFIIQKTKESNPEVSLFSDFELNIELLESLKNEIFGNQEGEGKDVFYDAWIDISKTPTNKFLAKDFITPHTNPLKNPTPLQFLKVLPRIGFNFQFSLNDGILNSTQKELLFKKILLTIGIGAKTNVGYGQFTETTVSTGEIIPQIIEEEKSNITDEIIHPSIEAIALINPEIRYKGKIVFQKKDNFILEFSIIEGEIIRLKKKGKSFKIGTPEKGKSVSLKFNIPYNKEEPIFTATLDE